MSAASNAAKRIEGGVVPLAMIQAGGYAGLRDSEAAVLLVLCAHTNVFSGQSCPSVPTIATECGRSVRTVERTIGRLRSKGLIQVDLNAGPLNANVYTLATTAAAPRQAGDGGIPRQAGDAPPRHLDTATPVICEPTPRHLDALPPSPHDGQTSEQQETERQQQEGTPSPTPSQTDPQVAAAVSFLEQEGIRGAGLQSLLTVYPELTPDDCERCFDEEDLGDGAGPGMRVTAIRNHAADVIAARKRREAQAEADRAQLGAALEKLAAAAAGLNGKLPTLKISGHTRMMLGARVLALLTAAGAPTWNAREWAGAVPADDPQAQAVFALAKHAEDDERRAADAECERQRREWEAGEPARRAEREKHEATQREAQARAEAAAAEKAAQAQRWVDAANAVRTMPDDEVLALWARTMTGEAVSEHYRRAHAGDEVTPDVLRREHGRRDAMTEQLLADRRALEVAA